MSYTSVHFLQYVNIWIYVCISEYSVYLSISMYLSRCEYLCILLISGNSWVSLTQWSCSESGQSHPAGLHICANASKCECLCKFSYLVCRLVNICEYQTDSGVPWDRYSISRFFFFPNSLRDIPNVGISQDVS
jgi:hypothetical protein